MESCLRSLEMVMYENPKCCSTFWSSKKKIIDALNMCYLDEIELRLQVIKKILQQIEPHQIQETEPDPFKMYW